MHDRFPDGPRGWLPGRALLSFPRQPEAFRRVSQKYGDLASFRVGRQQFFLISHPDLVREAFVTKNDSFVKGWGPQLGNSVLGAGLLTSEGEPHHAQRRLMLPAFHRQRLDTYAAAVMRHGLALRERWQDGADVDVLARVRSATIPIIAETLFGIDLVNDFDRLAVAANTILRRFSGRMHPFANVVRRLRFRSALDAAHARRELVEFAARVIAERRATPGDDLVSTLLEMQVPEKQVRDEIVTFFIAGHETVSIALAWSWRLLAEDPRAQERLQREVDRAEDLARLPYTQGVIAEALRLYPPNWMLGRRATERVEVGGAVVPEGAIVLLSLPTLHRDARWFDEPDAFRPERWAEGVDKSAQPFTYLPFGAGVRRCIGEGFAWMEARLLLALLAQRFEVESTRGAPRKTDARQLLSPREQPRLRFRRR